MLKNNENFKRIPMTLAPQLPFLLRIERREEGTQMLESSQKKYLRR
jgi:hypothetical protein